MPWLVAPNASQPRIRLDGGTNGGQFSRPGNEETPHGSLADAGSRLTTDGVGFEPTVRFHAHKLSRPAP